MKEKVDWEEYGLGALAGVKEFQGYVLGFCMLQMGATRAVGPEIPWPRSMYFQYDMDAGARDYAGRWQRYN